MMQTELELLRNSNVKKISAGRHTIYQGDCCEGLKMIRDNSVHLIVTSPPYNIGIDYGSYKDTLSFEQYTTFAEAWLKECFRILVNGGRICVNVPFTTVFGPDSPYNLYYNIMRKLGFKSREIIVWVKKRKCDRQFYDYRLHWQWKRLFWRRRRGRRRRGIHSASRYDTNCHNASRRNSCNSCNSCNASRRNACIRLSDFGFRRWSGKQKC